MRELTNLATTTEGSCLVPRGVKLVIGKEDVQRLEYAPDLGGGIGTS